MPASDGKCQAPHKARRLKESSSLTHQSWKRKSFGLPSAWWMGPCCTFWLWKQIYPEERQESNCWKTANSEVTVFPIISGRDKDLLKDFARDDQWFPVQGQVPSRKFSFYMVSEEHLFISLFGGYAWRRCAEWANPAWSLSSLSSEKGIPQIHLRKLRTGAFASQESLDGHFRQSWVVEQIWAAVTGGGGAG